ncbi:LmeA family phospholipid-binding protein [Actinocatenispora comari]|uniref:LmeA family phospholipid-binding protein n=1 Tax=Actinocatenispora comari TaxID=2807577 RepID=UPI001A927C3D|nr:DUF2993 domain-containing protein [Actinocatenispora comari]
MVVYAKPKRTRRKAPIVLLVLLIVIVLLLVAADRVGHSVADDKLADQVAAQAQSKDVKLGVPPTADITGFPFLTQVAAGKYDKILVHMRDVTVQSYAIPKLDITATGVHAKTSDVLNGNGPITADAVSGTATVGWGYVNQAAKEQLDQDQVKDVQLSGDNGTLDVRMTVNVLGQDLKLAGTAKPTLSDDGKSLRVSFADLHTTGSKLPDAAKNVLDGVLQQLGLQIKLPTLPYGLKLTHVDPQSDGLRVTAAANDVTLAE